ncbi:MAG: hypothetical protein IJQ85_10465 [Selenomonadaceae bacterium]|nr:hypothetical protein [Selenomonadaceae bacterium]
MTIKEVLEQLKSINQEKMLASLHDDMFFQESPDVDALNTVITLINSLAEKKPSDRVTVAEIFKTAEIEF